MSSRRVVVLDKVTDLLLFFGKLLVVGGVGKDGTAETTLNRGYKQPHSQCCQISQEKQAIRSMETSPNEATWLSKNKNKEDQKKKSPKQATLPTSVRERGVCSIYILMNIYEFILGFISSCFKNSLL